MGCSSSKQADQENTDAPRATQQETQQAQNGSSAPLFPITSNTGSSSHLNRLDIPNSPLRPATPVARCPPERALQPWTRSQLAAERTAFFDTRVSGDPAVWAALKVVCDALREGNTGTAQALMDAAGLTCPTGRIKSDKVPRDQRTGNEGRKRGPSVFDSSGRGYEIPGWIVRDPDDVVEDPGTSGALSGGEKDIGVDSDYDEEDEDTMIGGEKGKGLRADDGTPSQGEKMVKVRARLSDRGTDIIVDLAERNRVKVLIRKISEELGGGKKVRIVYLGKTLSEDKSLIDQGWQPGHVVNALVFDPAS